VLTTNSVQSALDVCRCEEPACVVLDLDMNDESGFEILIDIDMVPDRQHPEIAIVVLTRLTSTPFIKSRLSMVLRQFWLNTERRHRY
jgi:DNA-binding NarL/FixJ family response regulator